MSKSKMSRLGVIHYDDHKPMQRKAKSGVPSILPRCKGAAYLLYIFTQWNVCSVNSTFHLCPLQIFLPIQKKNALFHKIGKVPFLLFSKMSVSDTSYCHLSPSVPKELSRIQVVDGPSTAIRHWHNPAYYLPQSCHLCHWSQWDILRVRDSEIGCPDAPRTASEMF
jgi:hypothetical protein